MDAPTVVALTGAAAAGGGGIRWAFERRAAAKREARLEPIQDLTLLTKAASAIGEASAALLFPLRDQLAANTQKIEWLERDLKQIQEDEASCQARLAALEAGANG